MKTRSASSALAAALLQARRDGTSSHPATIQREALRIMQLRARREFEPGEWSDARAAIASAMRKAGLIQ